MSCWHGVSLPAASRSVFTRETLIAVSAVIGIAASLALRWAGASTNVVRLPLVAVLVAGGVPLVVDLARSALRGQFGSDLLAGISIVTRRSSASTWPARSSC